MPAEGAWLTPNEFQERYGRWRPCLRGQVRKPVPVGNAPNGAWEPVC